MTGRVFLVGAGPGDPGLLTIRAAEVIASADLIATDALVSPEILARIPPNAEVVYVGKRAAAHTLPQEKINELLIAAAKAGKRVVRLKGGDPFVFGRGGEEAAELGAAGVPVEIVPGISSAIAGPAYAGIPVTHRDYAASVTLVTGHESEESTGVDWDALARTKGTLVILMGLGNLGPVVERLTTCGMGAHRPIAVISRATTPAQRTVTATLGTIAERAADMEAPALIVVGDVVGLRDSIAWFEKRPLFGKRIVVTRAREQASTLSALLAESGADVVQVPTIDFLPPESFESLDRVIEERFDWIVFTSANGVRSFFQRLQERGGDSRALADAKIAAVGESTAAELRTHGIVADLVPEKFQSAALVPLLPHVKRTAVVRAERGRDELLTELRSRGGEVHLAVAYRTVPAKIQPLRGPVDLITFTSASTVENFFAANPDTGPAVFASIGPMTTEALRRLAREPEIVAPNATIEALHAAILDHVGRK